MPWVEKTVREGYFLEDMRDFLTTAGWTYVTSWTKIGFEFALSFVMDTTDVNVILAKHMVMKNADDEMVGFALATDPYKRNYGLCDPQPDPDNIGPFQAWASAKFQNKLRTSRIYMYMLEEVPPFADNEVICEWEQKDLLRMVLDAEVAATERVMYPMNPYPELVIADHKPTVMQSPIVTIRLRCDDLEPDIYANSNKDEANKIYATSWWYDSLIRMQGWLDDKKFFFAIRADTGGAWENNTVPFVPLFFGQFDPEKAGDVGNTALFAGTAEENTTPNFNYDDIEANLDPLYPILKEYPENASNGVDTVMVHRGAYGARYQSYYLSLHSAPHEMKPLRAKGNLKYPRAYNQVESPVFSYQYNPSNYSNRVLCSKIQLIHPDEGPRGSLPFSIGLNPMSLRRGAKLKVPTTFCPDPIYNWYYYFLFEGRCPFTRRPGVAYRPAGVGIFMKTE